MKKIISANIEKTLADKLELMSKESFPHVSKSAIVEYALENVNVENFIKGEINGNSEKTSGIKTNNNPKKK